MKMDCMMISWHIKTLAPIKTRGLYSSLGSGVWLILALLSIFTSSGVYADTNRNPSLKPPYFVSWGGIGTTARIKAAANIGINMHRLPIGWPDEQGNYDFRDFDRLFHALHAAGIQVIVSFGNNFIPPWFWQKHPDAKPRDAEGNTTEEYASPWNPNVQDAIEKNMAKVLYHLQQKRLLPLVSGVDIEITTNEGQLSFDWDTFRASDPSALKAYRNYLEQQYNGDLIQLDRDWSENYRSFDDIQPPRSWQDTLECHEFERFYRLGILNSAIAYAKVVRRFFHPCIWFWVSHFIKSPERYYAARYPRYYMSHLKALGMANMVETSSVAGWETKGQIGRLKQLGLQVIGEIDIDPTLKGQLNNFVTAKGLGCDGVFVGTLENLFAANGAPTSVGEETGRLISAWKNHRDLQTAVVPQE
jgi:hypothetical protein